MASTIGIKLANGEFYPILKENSQEKKRLVLTTVHDNQRSIQIDLYRSSSQSMADANYIGSLVMEKIKPQPKGQPSMELVISSSRNGDINAGAVDLESGTEGRQTLSVSLKSLDEVRQDFLISDFDLENDRAPPTGLYEPVGDLKQRKTWLPKVILVALILIVILLLIWFLFFFRGTGIIPCIQQLFQGSPVTAQAQAPAVSQPAPSQAATTPQAPAAQIPAQPATPAPAVAASQPSQPATTPAPAVQEPPAPPPVIQAPAEPPASVQVTRTRPVPPVASYNVPSVIPREGVVYRIRYGDTLWDISEAFYRNPWLYPQIARFNNIRNPDRIISGTTIRVPPRN